MSKKQHRRTRARVPRSTTPTMRSKETANWKRIWEASKACLLNSTQQFDTYVDGKCEGFRYLCKIYSHTNVELLAQTIDFLRVLRLDRPDWRRRLDHIARFEMGGSENDLAFALMRHLLEDLNWRNTKRAAECAVAELGLHSDSNSFEAAVQLARQMWASYKRGKFQPLGELVNQRGLLVKPNLEQLGAHEVRRIIDPYDQKPLPKKGKRVGDTPFWRNMIDLGVVVVADDIL